MNKSFVIIYFILLPGVLFSQDVKPINVENFKIILDIILNQKEVKKAFNSWENVKYKNYYTVAKVPQLSNLSNSCETIEIGNKKILYWPEDYIFFEDLYCLQFLNISCSDNSFFVEFRTYNNKKEKDKDVKYVLGHMLFLKKGKDRDWEIINKNIRFVDYKNLYPTWNLGFYIN